MQECEVAKTIMQSCEGEGKKCEDAKGESVKLQRGRSDTTIAPLPWHLSSRHFMFVLSIV